VLCPNKGLSNLAYGCAVCKVLDGSRDTGLEQIRAGIAWWFRRYANEQSREDRERYERAEEEARVRKVGLWRDPGPVRPGESPTPCGMSKFFTLPPRGD
jgi:endonuclease YncB( thermonuclease family)